MKAKVISIMDCGSVVRVFVTTGRGKSKRLETLDGDGNAMREVIQSSGLQAGDRIEFERNDWGGLASFEFA